MSQQPKCKHKGWTHMVICPKCDGPVNPSKPETIATRSHSEADKLYLDHLEYWWGQGKRSEVMADMLERARR